MKKKDFGSVRLLSIPIIDMIAWRCAAQRGGMVDPVCLCNGYAVYNSFLLIKKNRYDDAQFVLNLMRRTPDLGPIYDCFMHICLKYKHQWHQAQEAYNRMQGQWYHCTNEEYTICIKSLLLSNENGYDWYSDEIAEHAKKLIFSDDYAEAERVLLHGINKCSDDVYLHLVLGDLYQKQGLHSEAIACYEGILATNKGYIESECEYNIGYCYLQMHHEDEAEEHLRRALTTQPNMKNAKKQLGITLCLQGRHKESIKELEEVLNNDDDTSIPYWLGKCWKYLGEYTKAIECFEIAVNNEIYHAIAWSSMSLCYYMLEDDIKAISAAEKSLTLDACDRYVLMESSYVFADLGQLERVLDLYKDFLKNQPYDGYTNVYYAVFLVKNGDINKGMEIYRRAIEELSSTIDGAEGDLWRVLFEKAEYRYALEVCTFWLTKEIEFMKEGVERKTIENIIASISSREEAMSVILSSDHRIQEKLSIQSTRDTLEKVLEVR